MKYKNAEVGLRVQAKTDGADNVNRIKEGEAGVIVQVDIDAPDIRVQWDSMSEHCPLWSHTSKVRKEKK